MRLFLLLFAVSACIHCLCPDGFQLISEGQCCGTLKENATIHLFDGVDVAISKCKEINAYPVIIHNQDQLSYWKKRGPYIVGLICDTISKQWIWADGSAVDFKDDYSPELDQPCTAGCTWYGYPTGWDFQCGYAPQKGPIGCTRSVMSPLLPDGCEGFTDDVDNGVCYQIGSAARSWNDAQMICEEIGANLASIHNQQENTFVRRLAVSKGAVDGLFLGATISGKQDTFGWIDGSDWDYDNFYPGFPKAGYGDCVAMDTSTSSGLWMNFDCTQKLPVVCTRGRKELPVKTEPTCSTETWTENTLITSPGFPFNASVPCEFFFEVDAGKHVELEIMLLEANSCCDSLVIYDDYLSRTMIANITGQVTNATYTTSLTNFMRVSWSGGVNVGGVAMSFRGV